MDRNPEETAMIHYECYVCSMSATCVATETSSLAWHDHMATHVRTEHFGAWTWSVMPIPFRQA